MDERIGFVKALFDFSFSEFVTTKIIKILYGILMFFAGLLVLGIIVGGFYQSVLRGILALIVSPLLFLLYIIIARVWLELVIVIFRIAEHAGELVKQGKKEA
jgi:hypothetical protein